jgi:hypothetical protein
MISLGIDPDSKDLSLATWGPSGPLDARVDHVVGRASDYQMLEALCREDLLWCKKPNIVIIEGQQIDRRKARPQDLFKLAHVTGAIALRVRQVYRNVEILIPTPKVWKGSVAKHAMQARLYRELGWGYTIIGTGTSRYARPEAPPVHFKHISAGQWKHVGDALLLAKWGHDQLTA